MEKEINEEIDVSSYKQVNVADDDYIIEYDLIIPRHKPFTDILVNIATYYPNTVRLNDTWKIDYIQLEIMINDQVDETLKWIEQNGMRDIDKIIMTDFKYPTDDIDSSRVLLLVKIRI